MIFRDRQTPHHNIYIISAGHRAPHHELRAAFSNPSVTIVVLFGNFDRWEPCFCLTRGCLTLGQPLHYSISVFSEYD